MTKKELKALIKECLFESMNESDEMELKKIGFVKTNDDDDYKIFKKDEWVVTMDKTTGKYTLEDISDRNVTTYIRNGTIRDILNSEYL
jgi:hypothetical protein